jgi:hypothetical protein
LLTTGGERACHPLDLVNRICWKTRCERAEPYLDRDTLMEAADAYLLRKEEKPDSEEE